MNNETTQNIDIKKKVLEKITSDQVKMRPKFYFYFKLTGLFFLLIVTFIVTSLLVSYILFTLKISGHFFLLGFGLRGLQAFVMLFPWLFLIVDCFLFVVLEWFLKKFSFVYHNPLLYILLGSFGLIIAIGYLINLTSLHTELLKMNHDKQLPIIGSLYEDMGDLQEDGIFRGVVLSVKGNTFVIKQDDFDGDADDKEETIILYDIPGNDASKVVHVGEEIFVAGDRVGNEIRAYGIKEILPEY